MNPSAPDPGLCVDLPAEPWWVATIATQPVVYVTAALSTNVPPAYGCCTLPVRKVAERFPVTKEFARSMGWTRP